MSFTLAHKHEIKSDHPCLQNTLYHTLLELYLMEHLNDQDQQQQQQQQHQQQQTSSQQAPQSQHAQSHERQPPQGKQKKKQQAQQQQQQQQQLQLTGPGKSGASLDFKVKAFSADLIQSSRRWLT